MRSLVSIITPIYNAERWLAQAVESALSQTWRHIEVILVDDGSTDRSLEIAKSFASSNVRILSGPNRGGSAARNAGLAVAQGEFVQFLDADDVLHPQKIALQVARLEAGPPDSIASGAWGRLTGEDLDVARFVTEPVWNDLTPMDWIVTSHMGGGMMATGAWLCPRTVLDRAGLWSTRRMKNEDGEYFNRVILNSSAVLFVADAKTYYRSNIGGWSTARSEVAIAGLLWSLESITAEVLRREDSPRTRRALATSFDRFVFDTFPSHLAHVRTAERWIERLGGSAFRRPTGGLYGRVASVAGWKFSRRLQSYAGRVRAWWRKSNVQELHAAEAGEPCRAVEYREVDLHPCIPTLKLRTDSSTSR